MLNLHALAVEVLHGERGVGGPLVIDLIRMRPDLKALARYGRRPHHPSAGACRHGSVIETPPT